MKGSKPEALSRSTIIPLPKKGDLSLPSNYRGITLSALAAKLYNTMLLSATNCTLSGSEIFQGKPSLTSLEHALRVSSNMEVKPGQ